MKQEIYIDPYNSKIFDFNNVNSRVYLSRTINNLLKTFGDNCILDGLKVIFLDNNDNILKFKITKGKLIIDTTLVEITEDFILEYDYSNININNGYFVILASYNFLMSIFNNDVSFRIIFVNNKNKTKDFFPERDKIILTKINIIDNNVFYIKSNFLNNDYVTINNKLFKVYPASILVQNCIKELRLFLDI